jgi:Zn finger protein HypA/HybF involved in hydrogenase expression
MKNIIHMKGITNQPLCEANSNKITDIREDVTCEKCLKYGFTVTHGKNFYNRHHSKPGRI